VSGPVDDKTRAIIQAWKKEETWEEQQARLKPLIEHHVYWALVYIGNYHDAVKKVSPLEMWIDRQNFDREVIQIVKYINQLYFTKPANRDKAKGRITDDMIERARAFPYDQLIEVNKRGVALCPFHDDHHPSFSTQNNFGHCYVCKWSGDTIKFVMEKDKVRFDEAVKRLAC